MWEKLCNLVSDMLSKSQSEPSELQGRAVDWLPPVLGPEDWSIGMMAGHSAEWYLDRGRA